MITIYLDDPNRQAVARQKQLATRTTLRLIGRHKTFAQGKKICERCTIKFLPADDACKELPGSYCGQCHVELPCPCRSGKVLDLAIDFIKHRSPIDSGDTGSVHHNTRDARSANSMASFSGGERWR